MNLNISKGLWIFIGGVCIGLIGGYIWGKGEASDSLEWSLIPIEEQETSYTFIRPLLGYRVPEATLFGDYVSLKDSFQTIIDSHLKSNTVSRAAIYFRDLDAGRWVGINPDDTYYPASLLKVPVMIAYYKQAENNPSILYDTVSYNPQVLPNIPLYTPSTLKEERHYSINNLIKRMIIDSDNGATFTLLDRINPNFLDVTYLALGISDPGDDSANYKISTRAYGLFFRILYNATYLSPEYSERALNLLSQATFDKGLVAGVPKGTVVANKYGERVLLEDGVVNGVEFSDCGIIYYPAHPYLLCVMTNSAGAVSAANIIADLSGAAYAAVAERYAATPM